MAASRWIRCGLLWLAAAPGGSGDAAFAGSVEADSLGVVATAPGGRGDVLIDHDLGVGNDAKVARDLSVDEEVEIGQRLGGVR